MDRDERTPLPAKTRYWRFLKLCTGPDGRPRIVHVQIWKLYPRTPETLELSEPLTLITSQPSSYPQDWARNSDPKWLLKYAEP
jgi:hypothetical protein